VSRDKLMQRLASRGSGLTRARPRRYAQDIETSRNSALKISDPQRPLMRAFLRTPIMLYRTPLRAMLGPFYVLIEHRGRKSGRVCRTVVDRLHTDRETGEVFVTSAWGDKSDWFRNIQAAPASGVWIGRRRFEPIQRIVELEEAYEIHRKAKEERPLAIRFGLALVNYPFPKTEKDLRELTRFMPVVGFRRSEAS
jgi:deazaflavin-dependent oxidoreductase (nitroreductase family)